MLAREAEHRVKNVLATVQATVHLTQADTPERLKQAIEGRIQALANVHTLFVKSRWAGAELRSLVMQEILPYSQAATTAACRVDGPAAIPGNQYGADDRRGVARADDQRRQIRQPVGAGRTRPRSSGRTRPAKTSRCAGPRPAVRRSSRRRATASAPA